MKCFYRSLFGIALLLSFFTAVMAAPVIGKTAPSVNAFPIGITTQIDVKSVIYDPKLIPESVTLQRLNADGSITNIGVLHDDGLNGDKSPDDQVFMLRFSLNVTKPTQYRFRVSAAFKGTLQRSFSEPFSIYARLEKKPEQMLSTLAAKLSRGDLTAALTHFSSNPHSEEKLKSLTPEMVAAISEGIRTATLARSDGPTVRIYSVRIARKDGKSITTEIGLTQIPSGEWYVMFW
jgi:hypothetical protein